MNEPTVLNDEHFQHALASVEKTLKKLRGCSADEKRQLYHAICRLMESLQPTSLLDVGAGEGCFMRRLHKHVERYVALEPDERLFARLGKVAEGCSGDVQPYRCTFEEFRSTLRFDLVLSCHTLSYFRLKSAALLKMASLLLA